MSATEEFRAWWGSSGLSQAEVAAKLGVSQGYVSKLLSGAQQHPDVYVAVRIQELAGVPASSWPRRTRRKAGAKGRRPVAIRRTRRVVRRRPVDPSPKSTQ